MSKLEPEYYTTKGLPFTLEQMAACLQREYELRKRVYPPWIRDGRMDPNEAKYQIDCMGAAFTFMVRHVRLRAAFEDLIEEKPQPEFEF